MKKNSYQEDVLNYFHDKADRYDLVDKQSYWQLSDDLLWYSLQQILDQLPSDFSFLDAGGGTGRWSLKILENYPKATGIIYDLSADMLSVARQKIEKMGWNERIKTIQGNLEELDLDSNPPVDISFNFHNVLGFVSSPQNVIKKLTMATKKGGFIVSLVPNLYHNVFFNIMLGKIEAAAKTAASENGKFTDEMPSIHLFTPDSISKIYEVADLKVSKIVGFPITIYPGFQETQIEGSTASLQNLLSDKENYDKIFDIEKYFLSFSDTAARGNNILIIGKKK